MAEWLKARAWKVRIPQKGIVGSNPTLSAGFYYARRKGSKLTRKSSYEEVTFGTTTDGLDAGICV